MTATQIPAEYVPTKVKKRRVGTVLTAGVAGIAGVALAAVGFTVTQNGTGTYQGPTPPIDDVLDATDIEAPAFDLGAIPFGQTSGGAPCTFVVKDVAGTTEACAKPTTTSAVRTFTLHNKNEQHRAEIRVESVAAGAEGDQELYDATWIRVERRDPAQDGGANNLVYQGPLSAWIGSYMGNVCTGATQTFEAVAWTTKQLEGDKQLDFDVAYRVTEPADQGAC